METNLIVEGLKFMVLGMTTVFLFLMLMVFIMNVISKVVRKYFKTNKLTPLHARRGNPVASKSSDNDAVVAAIVASIQQFKKQ